MNRAIDRGFAIAFIALGAAFIFGSKDYVSTSYGNQVGSNVFPTIIGSICVILSIKLFFETFKYPKSESTNEKNSYDYKRFGIIVVATILYCLLLLPLGYVISTFFFLIVGFQTMNKGKWWISVIIALVISVGVYYIYVNILQGTLPKFPKWLDILN